MEKTHINPTDKELRLTGRELINLRVYPRTFEVTCQRIPTSPLTEESCEIEKRRYPLRCLQKFFRINGNKDRTPPYHRHKDAHCAHPSI